MAASLAAATAASLAAIAAPLAANAAPLAAMAASLAACTVGERCLLRSGAPVPYPPHHCHLMRRRSSCKPGPRGPLGLARTPPDAPLT
eukprot:48018-Prorocentrum_minimum.AAC.1